MTMSHIKQEPALPVQLYMTIGAALLTPVLFWPAFYNFSDHGLIPSQNLHQAWLIMAAFLFICAVTADSIINYRPNLRWSVFTCIWILFATLGASIALRLPAGGWLLALMFAIHSLRAMIDLWRGRRHWRLWPAWGRDTLAAAAIFIWSMH